MTPEEFFEALRARLRAEPPPPFEAPSLKLRDAAVLAPLFWRDGEPWVWLTRRPLTLRKHPGQISFPGGGREPVDRTPLHTALRETHEELGIPPSAVDVLGRLSELPTVTSFWVTPFVGVVPATQPLSPSPGEIDAVLAAPLWRLRRESRRLFYADRPAFVWDDGHDVVWGATFRMLEQLKAHVDAVR